MAINTPPASIQGSTPDPNAQPGVNLSSVLQGMPPVTPTPTTPPQEKYVPSAQDLQSAEPVSYTPSPEELSSAEVAPEKFYPLRDMTSDQLVQAAKDDPKNFDPVTLLEQSPDSTDATINEKVADAFNKLKQTGFYAPSAGTIVKNSVTGVWDFLKSQAYLGRVITSFPVVASELAKDAITGKTPDPSTFSGALTEDQRRQAQEYVAGLAQSGLGIGSQALKALHFVARHVPVIGEKSYADYTPQEKMAALGAELAVRSGMRKLSTQGLSPEQTAQLAREGFPMRPEEVATHAAGNPYAWELMGRGFGAATGAAGSVIKATVPEAVQAGVSSAAQKAIATVPKAVGGAMQLAGKGGEKVSSLVEKTAPITGRVGGGIAGGVAGGEVVGPAGVVLGVMEGAEKGAKLGEKTAGVAEKVGRTMEGLQEVGKQVAGKSPLVSPVAVGIKSAAEAALPAAAQVGAGGLFDLGLQAVTAETPQEKEQFTPFGTIFGALGAAKTMGGHTLSGLIAAPRDYGSKIQVPSSKSFPTLDSAHADAIANATDGVKTRLNAIRGFAKTAAPGTDIFYVPKPESGPDPLPDLLQKMQTIGPDGSVVPIDPATAQKWSDTAAVFPENGLIDKDGNARKVIIARDVEAVPHDVRHAMDDVLGDSAVRVLNQAAKNSYTPEEWNQFANQYAARLPGGLQGNALHTILNASGWGDAQATEKIISQVRAEMPDATADQIKAEAGNRINAARAAVPAGKSFWETQLTPAEQQDVLDNYVGSEVRAENHDAWFKGIGTSNHVVDRMARAAANMTSILGGEPLSGRAAEFSNLPLRYPVVKAAEAGARTTGVGKPVIIPKVPKVTAPPGSPKGIQQQEDRNNQIAAKAPDVALPGAAKTQREMMGVLNEARTSGTPVEIQYGHAGGSAPAAGAGDEPPEAILGAVNRSDRRDFIQAWRTMPIETRTFAAKLFSPENFMVTRDGRYQAYGGVHAVLAANAQKLATFLLEHPEVQTPYAVDPATKSFTPDSWKQIFDRVQDFSWNQEHGRAGSGAELVVPKMKGYFPPQVTGEARPIPQAEADIVNALFGTQTPTTARIAKADVLPLNIAGQRVSEATLPGRVEQPSIVSPAFGEPGASKEHLERAKKLGITGEHVLETNPFLQKINAYADAPSFIEARQRLNLEHMADVNHAPAEAPQLRGNTLTLAAGFQPSAEPRAVRTAAVRDEKTGKVYEGPMHAMAMLNLLAERHGVKPDEFGNFPDNFELRAWNSQPDVTEGYTTNTPGEFLNRDEAFQRAQELKQYTPRPGEDSLESTAFRRQQALREQGYNPAELAGAFQPAREEETEPKTFIVRHGSTELNNADPKKDLIRGHMDVPLDDKGRQEAKDTAAQIAAQGGVQTIIHSGLSRTRDTANEIAAANPGAKVVEDQGLRPWKFGPTIEGKPTADMLPKIKELTENPDQRPPGGETFHEFKDRFINAFHRAQLATRDENSALVTHYRGQKLLDAWRATGTDNDSIDKELFEQYDPNRKPGNIDVVNKAGAKFQPSKEEEARFAEWERTRPAYERVPWWKQPMKGETETGRHSSFAGDADQGVVLHSAKQRSTLFVPKGAEAERFLSEWDAAKTPEARDALVESHFTQGSAAGAQFMPRKTKQDWELKEDRGSSFSRAWIKPDGNPVQLGSKLHHDWVNENPEVTRQYGLTPTTSSIDNRNEALQKGFARVIYDKHAGTFKVEARQTDWPNLKESVRRMWDANKGKIDNFDVHLLDDKAKNIVEQDGVALHTYDPGERADHLPLITETSPTTTMSPQASAQFMPMSGNEDEREIRLARQFWITSKGITHAAYGGHEAEAVESILPDKIVNTLPETEEDGRVSAIYDAMRGMGNVRGVFRKTVVNGTLTDTLDLDGKPYSQLSVPTQKEITRVSQAMNAPVVYNGRDIDTGVQVEHGPLNAQFQTAKPEDFKDEKTLPAALRSPNWAVLTATQESRGPGTNDVNDQANDNLQTALTQDGYHPIPVAGKYKGVDQGKNFLVPNMTPDQALKYGKQYNQESVLTPDGLLYQDGSVNPANHDNTVVGPEATKKDFYSQIEGGPAFSMDIDFDKKVEAPHLASQFQPKQSLLGGGEEEEPAPKKRFLTKDELSQMTNKQLSEFYPEAIVPPRHKSAASGKMIEAELPSKITESPLEKKEGVQGFVKRLVDFAKSVEDTPEYQAGKKWYSDFTKRLNKEFGKHAPIFAELLSATSPNTTPDVNFGFAYDALQMYLAGKMDSQIKKYQEGLALLEPDANGEKPWRKWYDTEVAAGRVKPPANITPETFVAQWINSHNLEPRQSNGKRFGMHSVPVLNVAARTWLERNAGPKTQNFIKNLLGTGDEATIDVWADRTMRRLGYSEFQPRWRILPKNKKGVSDADFTYSQDAFRQAAEQLGMEPSALQGALWFAEKRLWADNGWVPLDLGDFTGEMKTIPARRAKFEQNIAAANAPVQQELVAPRPTR